MYCPQCATAQADTAKFCRSCGLALETIALAVRGEAPKPATPDPEGRETIEDWLEFQAKKNGAIIRGGILFGVSVAIAVPMGLFLPRGMPWMVVWSIFFGWMACWGAIDLAFGLSGLLEANSRLRRLQNAALGQPVLAPASPARPVDGILAEVNTAPMSVTEGTTRHLQDRMPN
jgi:hypothetical protein